MNPLPFISVELESRDSVEICALGDRLAPTRLSICGARIDL